MAKIRHTYKFDSYPKDSEKHKDIVGKKIVHLLNLTERYKRVNGVLESIRDKEMGSMSAINIFQKHCEEIINERINSEFPESVTEKATVDSAIHLPNFTKRYKRMFDSFESTYDKKYSFYKHCEERLEERIEFYLTSLPTKLPKHVLARSMSTCELTIVNTNYIVDLCKEIVYGDVFD